MNTRQRTKLRYMCKHMDFENFNLMEFLTTDSVPGRKESIKKKYITLVMRNHRKWLTREMAEEQIGIDSFVPGSTSKYIAFVKKIISEEWKVVRPLEELASKQGY